MSRNAVDVNALHSIAMDGGAMPAYVARPDAATAPAIVMIPSIYGLNDDMRAKADGFAAAGFIAVATDIFWRGDGGALSPNDAAETARARARNDAFDTDRGIDDIAAVARFLAGDAGYNGRYAVAGYCFGGRFAFLAAARLAPSAIVSFHGSHVGDHLDEAAAVTAPASFHYGDSDAVAPMAEIERIRAALAHNAAAELFIYPGVGHNFTNPNGASYDAAVAMTSMQRALRILDPLKT